MTTSRPNLLVAYLATPGGEDALALGAQLALSLHTELKVCLVVPPSTAAEKAAAPGDFQEILDRQATTWLDDALSSLPDGVDAEGYVAEYENTAEGLSIEARRLNSSMIVVGVFVSLPFTIFVFIAGLNAIPDDVMEAATVDGASPWQRYRHVTLPLLKPALLVASVLNVIYVFNSFPIVYTLNDRNPGYAHDTTITFMYKLAFKSQEKDVGMSAAAGIFNVILILVVIAIYMKVVSWKEETR